MNIAPIPRARLRCWLVTAGWAVYAPAVLAQAQPVCGSLRNAYGPFDYRTDRGEKLYLVESGHFTPEIEAVIRGHTGPLGADLDYTLRAFPNHHRALVAMTRYALKLKLPQVPNANYSVDCYFERAMRFRKDDGVVPVLYAVYLGQAKRDAEALQQLAKAQTVDAENGFTQYNIGLVYFDMKHYDEALAQALKAQQLGFTGTQLADRLKAANRWKEPSAVPAAPASAASQ
jgi:tetratricopeptide (TPR) repeat protein